ncbi:MAG: hypothetical protein ACI9MC_003403 [Kiritimatiellia bacterium]|jgi:hypothetical protein
MSANGTSSLILLLVAVSFLLAGIYSALIFAGPMLAGDGVDWRGTTCTIDEVSVLSSPAGAHYRVAVQYHFDANGERHTGSSYDLDQAWSDNRGAVEHTVAQLRQEPQVSCSYTGDEDVRSVIVLKSGVNVLFLLFPAGSLVVALVAGTVGVRRVLDGSRRSLASRARSTAPYQISKGVGAMVLRERSTASRKLLTMLAVTVLWDGLVAGLWLAEAFDGSLSLFIGVVFSVIAALITGLGLPYSFFALLNPRPVLSLSSGKLHPGSQVELRWAFDGSARRIRRLTISLQGQEVVTYRRGTDTTFTEKTFHESVVVDLDDGPLHDGVTILTIPDGTMPSFDAKNNKVQWKLKVNGNIALWPDIATEFNIAIYPHDVQS